jgi:hypothetical protein
MTQAIGTQNIPFSHDRFPITPDTMGNFSRFSREMLIKIFKHLDNHNLASSTMVNWTFKEVIERTTDWGERKRFFRILPSLFKLGTYEETTRPDPIPVWAAIQVQQTLENVYLPSQELSQILNHYPNSMVRGTGFRPVDNVVLMHYWLQIADHQALDVFLLYEIDMQKESPHLRQVEHYYRWNRPLNKLQKLTFGNPPVVVNELSSSEFTTTFAIEAVMGNWLLAWVGGYDYKDQDNPEKNFNIIQAINKATLQSEITYNFYTFPDTPLPFLITNIYLDNKFCIVISTRNCAIKMGKSTIRIDQKILKPLLGMRIDHFSIQNRPDGQMEITLKGVKDKKDICMQYTTDPFYPVLNPPAPFVHDSPA